MEIKDIKPQVNIIKFDKDFWAENRFEKIDGDTDWNEIVRFIEELLEKQADMTRTDTIVEIFRAGDCEDYYEQRKAMTYLNYAYENLLKTKKI